MKRMGDLIKAARTAMRRSRDMLKRAGDRVRSFAGRRRAAARVATPDPIPARLSATIAAQPGLTCPRCRHRIQVTIPALLGGQPIICPQCLFALNVDAGRSSEALGALKKLQGALERAEAMTRR